MEQDKDLAAYCARVLGLLKLNISGTISGSSDAIHVYVNERRVGALGGREAESSLQFQRQGCVDHIQLRSEDGAILGSLSAPEFGFRAVRILLVEGAVELRIRNTAEGGSASAVFTQASQRRFGLLRALVESVQAKVLTPSAVVSPRGVRTVVVMQTVLVALVLGLVADRIAGGLNQERQALHVTRDEVPWAAQSADVSKLEEHLGELARMQEQTWKTIHAQQEGMTQLQRVVARLALSEDGVGSGLSVAREKRDTRQDESLHGIARMSSALTSQAQREQEGREGDRNDSAVEHQQPSSNEERLGSIEQEQELGHTTSEQTDIDISKATITDHDHSMPIRQSESSEVTSMLPLAEAGGSLQPFLFWVNFSEGTTQESIDQWVHDMQGHMGGVNEGWQEVEIMHPSMPTDRFLEQVRGAKIVKAVRVDQ